ncbi:MAG: hypothetical protein JNL28_15680 [Planctomycetes bacterium]|nr:hypothetical protein [Planctomycetota bacterium]
MNRSDIAVLTLRLVSVYLFTAALMRLTDFSALLPLAGDGADEFRAMTQHVVLSSAIAVALQIVLALVVFRSASRLAAWLCGETPHSSAVDRLAIGALAISVTGILVLNDVLSTVPGLLLRHQGSDPARGTLNTLLVWCAPVSLALLGGFALWRSQAIAHRLFHTVATPRTPASVLAQAVAFSVLGMWFVVGALPELVAGAVHALRSAHPDESFFGLDSGGYPRTNWILNAVRCAFGVVLFVGAAGWARAWHRLRTAGLSHAE